MKTLLRIFILMALISLGGLASIFSSSGGIGGSNIQTWSLGAGEALMISLYLERNVTIVVDSDPSFEGRLAILDRKGYELWSYTGELKPILLKKVTSGFLLEISYPCDLYFIVVFNEDSERHQLDIMIRSGREVQKHLKDELGLMMSLSLVCAMSFYLFFQKLKEEGRIFEF
ncbi:MAG TPA: hypothetical protein EYP68_00600 [Candidatus Korarchaeota archaeon]|nr:hypothetical protein [Candidatus Korarchaeota archaeon]